MPPHHTPLLAVSTSTSTVAVCLLYLQHLCLHPPLVHSIVHYGVDAAVGHCKPVEDEVHVLGVPGPHDAGVVMDDDEVGVVWQPADSEDAGHYTEHFDNLKQQIMLIKVAN